MRLFANFKMVSLRLLVVVFGVATTVSLLVACGTDGYQLPDRAAEVWRKGEKVGNLPDGLPDGEYRLDYCGALIMRNSYAGNHEADSRFVWDIDHIIPKAREGLDEASNLRPLHRENNRAKGNALDKYWICRTPLQPPLR